MTEVQEPSGDVTSGGDPRKLLAFWGLLVGLFLSTLDQSIIAAALPSLVSELGGLSRFAWVLTAYGLALSVTTPLCGKLGDLFGHRRVFLGGVGVFVLGSALCGLAGSMTALIGYRVVQGIGAGALVVSAFSLVGQLFPPAERARYQGYSTGVFAVASVAGPLVGGLITELLGWRWTFYVNLPIGVVALMMVGMFAPTIAPTRQPRIDYGGAALLAAAAMCIALLASWAGTHYAWTSPAVLALSAGAVLALCGWVLAERRAAEPIIPLSLFRDSTFNLANAVTFLAGFAILASVNFLPVYLQAAAGASAMTSGVLLAPMMFGLVAASILTGKRVAKRKRYKWFPVVSMALTAVSAYLLSTMTADTRWPLVVAYSVLLGVGSGLSLQVFVVAVQNTAPPSQIGAATAAVTFSRLVGASFGITTLGAVFTQRFSAELPARTGLPPTEAAATARMSAHALELLPPAVRTGFTAAYATALHTVFLTTVPVLLVAFLLSLALRDRELGGGPAVVKPAPVAARAED